MAVQKDIIIIEVGQIYSRIVAQGCREAMPSRANGRLHMVRVFVAVVAACVFTKALIVIAAIKV
jgi:hypothetical protein